MNWYIGPWQGVVDDGGSVCWYGPVGTFSAIDYRSLPEQAVMPTLGVKAGIGLFCSTAIPRDVGRDWQSIGKGNWHDIKADQRLIDAFPKRLGATLDAPDLVGLVRQSLMDADPTGDSFVKPLQPGQGRLSLYCGGQSHHDRFQWGRHTHTNRLRDTLRADFRKTFEAAQAGELKDREHHRRVLDALCDKYGIADWREFVPDDLQADIPGRLKHETTITESFNTADSDTLGPNLTWTELVGDIDIVSNQARSTTLGSQVIARADSDLSSVDHYVQASVGAGDETTSSNPGVIGRKDGTATLTFYLANGDFVSNVLRLFKCVAGAFTQLGSNVSLTLTSPTTYLFRLTCNGSSITHTVDSVDQTTQTDTAITAGLRCGLRGQKNTSTYVSWDSFEAADLGGGGGGILYTQLERGLRGYERGVYQGSQG